MRSGVATAASRWKPGSSIWSRLIPLLFLFLGPWVAHATGAQSPEAGDDINVAGLVIDYGDGRTSYAVVAFSEPTLSAIEMLRRSGLSLVTVPFGGLGEAVCAIGSTGCDVGDCQSRLCQSANRESPFWQFVRQAEDGSWAAAALGASRANVEDGDVDGWIWSGMKPDLPPLDIASLRERLRVPSGWSSPGDGLPEPIVVTEGAIASDETPSWRQLVPGLIVLAGVGATGWVVVSRTRRSPPDPG